MVQQVFVISDLHLGGADGFQMCGPQGQALLAEFIAWVTAQHRSALGAHLVLAGDVVDFLAETPATAFTRDEREAARKLEQIFARTAPIWSALAAHVRAGARLTVLLGNHDVEMSLPAPRHALLDRLGAGRVEMLYDDEALRIGGLLVEHGNRYDDWNWVNHEELRRARRDLSRGKDLPAGAFTPMPGSRLVIDVMNPLKRDFSFVDLLKPEDATVVPFLALLRPGVIPNSRDMVQVLKDAVTARLRAWAPWNVPARDLAAEIESSPSEVELADQLALAESVVRDASAWRAREASRGPSLDLLSMLLRSKRVPEQRAVYLDKLLTVLRARWGEAAEAFDLNLELPQYCDAARESAQRGCTTVVYGHTHLVKRVDLGGGARYLNTGTWADIMRVPTRILSPETQDDQAIAELDAFASDLTDPAKAAHWRRQMPTFARAVLADDGTVVQADVHRFKPGAALKDMFIEDGPIRL